MVMSYLEMVDNASHHHLENVCPSTSNR